MAAAELLTSKSAELFDIFRQGAQLARQINAADEMGMGAPGLVDEFEDLTYDARELAIDESLKVSAIDGNKRPFVHHFRVNELSMMQHRLGDLKEIPGYRGRYQADEDYSMCMFPGFYRNLWPLLGHVTGKVLAVDLETSDLVIKQKA